MSDYLLNLVRRGVGIALDAPPVRPDSVPIAVEVPFADAAGGSTNTKPTTEETTPTKQPQDTADANSPEKVIDAGASGRPTAAESSSTVHSPSPVAAPAQTSVQRAPADAPSTTLVAPRPPAVAFPTVNDGQPSGPRRPAVVKPPAASPVAELAVESESPRELTPAPAVPVTDPGRDDTSAAWAKLPAFSTTPSGSRNDARDNGVRDDRQPTAAAVEIIALPTGLHPRDNSTQLPLSAVPRAATDATFPSQRQDSPTNELGGERAEPNSEKPRASDDQPRAQVAAAGPKPIESNVSVAAEPQVAPRSVFPAGEPPLRPITQSMAQSVPPGSVVEPDAVESFIPEPLSRPIKSPQRRSAGVAESAPTVVSPRPPVQSVSATASEVVGKQPTQSVQVHIGSVEIRATKPAAEAAPSAPRRAAEPLGFESYRKLRGYLIEL